MNLRSSLLGLAALLAACGVPAGPSTLLDGGGDAGALTGECRVAADCPGSATPCDDLTRCPGCGLVKYCEHQRCAVSFFTWSCPGADGDAGGPSRSDAGPADAGPTDCTDYASRDSSFSLWLQTPGGTDWRCTLGPAPGAELSGDITGTTVRDRADLAVNACPTGSTCGAGIHRFYGVASVPAGSTVRVRWALDAEAPGRCRQRIRVEDAATGALWFIASDGLLDPLGGGPISVWAVPEGCGTSPADAGVCAGDGGVLLRDRYALRFLVNGEEFVRSPGYLPYVTALRDGGGPPLSVAALRAYQHDLCTDDLGFAWKATRAP